MPAEGEDGGVTGPARPQGATFSGGSTGVALVGGTARRRTDRWSPTVHRLLRHVRGKGVPEAPAVLGVDGDGREVLRWIDGDCRISLDDDDRLRQVADLTRRVGTAMSSFEPQPGDRWRCPRPRSTIGHRDMAPWNVVFRGSQLVGHGGRMGRSMAWLDGAWDELAAVLR
jgi:hypothetical protein